MSNNNLSQERISQKLTSSAETKSSKGIIIAITCSAVLLIAVVAIVLILVKPSNDTEKRNAVVTPENVDEVLADLQDNQKTQAGQYEVTMNTSWEFENGGAASSNAYVENSTSNSNDVYFDIVRSDTNETIYKSPTIPVGSHLEDITLDTKLDAGNYSCVLTYHLLDDEGKPISKLNINLDITVKN